MKTKLLFLALLLSGGLMQDIFAQERVWLGKDTTDGAIYSFKVLVDEQNRVYSLVNEGVFLIFPGIDPQVIAWDSQGNIRWKYVLGSVEEVNFATGAMGPDNCLVIAARTRVEGVYLEKINPDGSLRWRKTLPLGYSVIDMAISPQGDIYIAGSSQTPDLPQTGVLRYDHEGNLLWAQSFAFAQAPANVMYADFIRLMPDGDGVVVSCFGGARNGTPVLRIDQAGNELWQTFVEVQSDSVLRVRSRDLIADATGACYLALSIDSVEYHSGRTSYDTKRDSRLVKLSPAGEVAWYVDYAPPGPKANLQSLALDPAGNLLVAGDIQGSLPNQLEGYAAKYQPDGQRLWERRLYFYNGGMTLLNQVRVDSLGYAYVAGVGTPYRNPTPHPGHCCTSDPENNSRWHWMIYKLNPFGEEVWRLNEGGRGGANRDWLYDLALAPNGDVLATGWLMQRPYSLPGRPAPIYAAAAVGRYTNPAESLPYELSVFPNPARERVTFEVGLPAATEARLSLFDLRGRRIMEEALSWPTGRQRFTWEPEQLAAGLYLYRLQMGGETFTGKLVWE
jgi:outer membrane protein assembly factor BamB